MPQTCNSVTGCCAHLPPGARARPPASPQLLQGLGSASCFRQHPGGILSPPLLPANAWQRQPYQHGRLAAAAACRERPGPRAQVTALYLGPQLVSRLDDGVAELQDTESYFGSTQAPYLHLVFESACCACRLPNFCHAVITMASLLQGFASINTEQAGASGQQLTLEAQEARVINAYEHALSLVQAQRLDEAQVMAAQGCRRSCCARLRAPTDRQPRRRGQEPRPPL